MKRALLVGVLFCAACAGGPQIGYESAPDSVQGGDAADAGEAQALEQAEADCARQGKHAESKRIEGETVYDCAD
ncbi:MAG TPA: hypothetical protein VEK10_02750 [Steroidobacteraceae bacterium]|nr:hypothetical protein [Steroidobacteraceae bacterium]